MPPTNNPVIIPHYAVLGEVAGRGFVRSTLPSVSPVLVALGATSVLVPTPTELDREHARQAISRIPKPYRDRVRLIDTHGTTLKRVIAYVRPLREAAAEWPEDAFAGIAEHALYLTALGARYGAAIANTRLETLNDFLPILRPRYYKDLARFRLAEIGSISTRYQPFELSAPRVGAQLSAPGVSAAVEDFLDSAEFADLAYKYGRLGYLRRPGTALRRIRSAVTTTLTRPAFRTSLKVGAGAAQLATVTAPAAGPATALEAIAGVLDRGRQYSPPILRLDPMSEYLAALQTLHAVSPRARFQNGCVVALTYSSGITQGVQWLAKGEERNLNFDARKWRVATERELVSARRALPNLAASE